MPIGTAAAIAIGLGTAGAQVASNIYGSKRAAGVNEEAIRTEREMHEAELAEAEKMRAYQAEEEQKRREFERRRYTQYLQSRQPYARAAGATLNSLLDLAGVQMPSGGGAAMPAGAPPSQASLATLASAQQAMPAPGRRAAPVAGAPPAPAGAPVRGRSIMNAANRMPMPERGWQVGAKTLLDLASLVQMYGGQNPLKSRPLPSAGVSYAPRL